jgi:poly(A) polymerase
MTESAETDSGERPDSSLLTERLAGLRSTIDPLAERFADAGHRLYLVGGIVRDLQLGRLSGFDIDFTTDARPRVIKQLVDPLADAVWTQGERFGTIGASVNGDHLEITTHRAERYDPESRKPVVSFGDELHEDLSRRDFTINAIAIEVPGDELHDPFGGATDLADRVLRTPLSPEVSFTDDPLRMLRAARFMSRFKLTVDHGVLEAATALASRIEIVSVERVADEIERLLAVDDPTPGLEFLRTTGLLSLALAKMSDADERLACALAARPPLGGTDDSVTVLVRRSGLLWSTDVRAVLSRLRYSNHHRATTVALVGAVREWVTAGHSTPADGRRLLSEVGDPDAPLALAANLVAVHPDAGLAASARRLIETLEELRAAGDVGPFDPPLSGAEIMAALDIAPGPVIGQIQRFLRSHRLDHGPFTADEAVELIRGRFAENPDL